MYLFDGLKQSGASGRYGTASDVRIGHINLRVADLDRAMTFYCDVLGLSVVYYAPSIGLPTVFLAFGDCYHHHIALTWFYNTDGGLEHPRRGGMNHFAIVYPDEVSLAKAVARILDHGEVIEDARDQAAHCPSISVIPTEMGSRSTSTDREVSGSIRQVNSSLNPSHSI